MVDWLMTKLQQFILRLLYLNLPLYTDLFVFYLHTHYDDTYDLRLTDTPV